VGILKPLWAMKSPREHWKACVDIAKSAWALQSPGGHLEARKGF